MTIDLNLAAEQRQILASVGQVLADVFPVARLRGRHGASPDQNRLSALAELGVFGLGCADNVGGAGFSTVEDTLVFVELGRHLVTPHVLAATLAAHMALALGRTELARQILTGQQTVCIANALAPFDHADPAGVAAHLLDGQDAALAVLWNDGGMVLLQRDVLALQSVDATDRSLPLQRCMLSESAVSARLAAADAPLPRLAHLLLSAMFLGMAEATRDMAAQYARLRVQFGQPIGAFQAVKHRCADMAIGAEALRAQLVFAAIAERDAWPDAEFQVDALRVLAPRCALANAAANIQVHGGIGFTAECDAHLYLLRAHLYEHLGGPVAAVKARLAGPVPSEAGPPAPAPTTRTS